MVEEDIIPLSISTYKWPNKHKFNDHWGGVLPSKRMENPKAFIETHFPEANLIFK
jgi:hypothetical protein